jgi:protein involved in polysaccharide export with SLBB domain
MGLALVLSACTSVEDKRIRQLMNEKGFGTQAAGNATKENYVTGGDTIHFNVDPLLAQQSGATELAWLSIDRQVNIDGTIWVPYLGSVYVLGKTETELGAYVSSSLQRLYSGFDVKITAQILGGQLSGKAFFVIGEAAQRGRIQMTRGDLTIFDVIMMVGTTNLANIGRIHLIKPDAENPLDVVINFREMATSGLMKYNLPIYENDIIYIPPTFFGMLARFLERLLAPLTTVVNALFQATNLRATYEYAIYGTGSPGYYGSGYRF